MEVVTEKSIKNTVPEEYKRTEVGMIPNDWEMRFIKDLAHIGTGGKNTEDKVDDGRYPFFVRSSKVERINSYSFDGEAVLTAGDGVNTGKIFHYINDKFDYHQRVYKISNFNNDIDGYYFYLAFSQYFYERVMGMTAKSSVDSVRMEMIANMKLPFPPTLKEQQAIAEALSDVDALIAELDALIEKKQQIKKGAMQQLLTGKKRLPGFDGEWEEKKLGDVGQCLRGVSYDGSSDLLKNDTEESVRLLRANNIKDFQLDLSDIQIVPKQIVSEYQILKKNDVVICMASGSRRLVGKATRFKPFAKFQYTFGAFMGCYRVNSQEANPIFISFIFQTRNYRKHIEELTSGTSINNLKPSDIQSIEIPFPPLEEQKAIAEILSDMDTEILALKSKRSKYEKIKQGMMQELLTGKTRLVETKEVKSEGHNWQYDEAVILSVLVDRFGNPEYPLGRFRRTKLNYLTRRFLEKKVDRYLKKAAGPYSSDTRYKGPEGIALKKDYVKEWENEPYTGFIASDNVEEACTYFHDWYGNDVLDWIEEQFKFKDNDGLELITTVDKAIVELYKKEKGINLSNIKSVIESHPEWKEKLERDLFSDENIEDAIEESLTLFG